MEITEINSGKQISGADKGVFENLPEDIRNLAKDIVENVTTNEGKCYLVKYKYNEVVWDNKELYGRYRTIEDEKEEDLFPGMPVGLVLTGVLEVTEEFKVNNVARRRSTALIRPGHFFGLFEAFANLYGLWRITSGVARILITNRLLRHLPPISVELNRTLNFEADADYNYDGLLSKLNEAASKTPGAKIGEDASTAQHIDAPEQRSEWSTSILLFDILKVGDLKLKCRLQSETIYQLASLAKQNPEGTSFVYGVNRKTLYTLSAMLRGHIPVFRLVKDSSGAPLPYKELLSVLGYDPKTGLIKGNQPPHIFVPDYIQYDGNFYLYIDVLSGKLDLSSLLSEVSVLYHDRKNGRTDPFTKVRINDFRIVDNNSYCVDVELIDENERFTIHKTARMHRGPVVLPDSFIKQLSIEYPWPNHLSEMIVIEHRKQINQEHEEESGSH